MRQSVCAWSSCRLPLCRMCQQVLNIVRVRNMDAGTATATATAAIGQGTTAAAAPAAAARDEGRGGSRGACPFMRFALPRSVAAAAAVAESRRSGAAASGGTSSSTHPIVTASSGACRECLAAFTLLLLLRLRLRLHSAPVTPLCVAFELSCAAVTSRTAVRVASWHGSLWCLWWRHAGAVRDEEHVKLLALKDGGAQQTSLELR